MVKSCTNCGAPMVTNGVPSLLQNDEGYLLELRCPGCDERRNVHIKRRPFEIEYQ